MGLSILGGQECYFAKITAIEQQTERQNTSSAKGSYCADVSLRIDPEPSSTTLKIPLRATASTAKLQCVNRRMTAQQAA